MFSHIMVGANDVEKSKRFYDAILATMDCKLGVIDEKGRCFYFTKSGVFAISKPIDGEPSARPRARASPDSAIRGLIAVPLRLFLWQNDAHSILIAYLNQCPFRWE